jgi:hypothetical protein
MLITRRDWLSITTGKALTWLALTRMGAAAGQGPESQREQQVARLIRAYGEQGFHRTGTWPPLDEIGYLGIEAFVAGRPGIVTKSRAWIHLGANIGAATDPANALQASDDYIEGMAASAITALALRVDRRNPRGTVPAGEAGVVHRGGGRYVSVIGSNALFHNPLDRGSETIDATAIVRFADALANVAKTLAGS